MAIKVYKPTPPSAEVLSFLASQGLSADDVTGITIHTGTGDVEIEPEFEEV